MASIDKPNITLSIAELEAEVGKPEPYVVALRSGKRVTFPDIFDRPAEEAEKFLSDLHESSTDFAALEKWLSPEDFKKYKEAKLPMRTHAALIKRVMAYYEQTVGTPGEDNASAS